MLNDSLHLVISLDRTPDRWNTVSEAFYSITGFYPKKVSAIDKLSINENLSKTQSNTFRPLSSGEIACFLSHRACWKKILDSNLEWGLIMEDDIYFTKDAFPFINSPSWIPKDVDFCQISSYTKNNQSYWSSRYGAIKLTSGHSLEKINFPTSWGTQAYWINQSGCKRALELSYKIELPVDEFLLNRDYSFSKSTKVRSLCPFVVYQDFFVESLIDEERKLLQKIDVKESFVSRLKRKFVKLTSKKILRTISNQNNTKKIKDV